MGETYEMHVELRVHARLWKQALPGCNFNINFNETRSFQKTFKSLSKTF